MGEMRERAKVGVGSCSNDAAAARSSVTDTTGDKCAAQSVRARLRGMHGREQQRRDKSKTAQGKARQGNDEALLTRAGVVPDRRRVLGRVLGKVLGGAVRDGSRLVLPVRVVGEGGGDDVVVVVVVDTTIATAARRQRSWPSSSARAAGAAAGRSGLEARANGEWRRHGRRQAGTGAHAKPALVVTRDW